MKEPFQLFKEIFKKNNLDEKELLKYVFEKSDAMSLWIIGLSIGGISIFANNIANIQKNITHDNLKLLLIFLSVSVVSGILYRISYLYFFVVLNNTHRGIDVAFSDYETYDFESQLLGNETFEELVLTVKKGIFEDLSFLIQYYNNLDSVGKAILYNSVVTHYLQGIELSKNQVEIFFDFAAETYSKFTGYTKENYLKKFGNEQSIVKTYKRTFNLTAVLYLIYIGSFILSLFFFVFTA